MYQLKAFIFVCFYEQKHGVRVVTQGPDGKQTATYVFVLQMVKLLAPKSCVLKITY
jgi:hypothetical protein